MKFQFKKQESTQRRPTIAESLSMLRQLMLTITKASKVLERDLKLVKRKEYTIHLSLDHQVTSKITKNSMFHATITATNLHSSPTTFHLKEILLTNKITRTSILVFIRIGIALSRIYLRDLVTALLVKIIFTIMTKTVLGNDRKDAKNNKSEYPICM